MGQLFTCLYFNMFIKSAFLFLSCFVVLLEAKQLPEDRHGGGRPGGFGFGGSYGGSHGGSSVGSFGGSSGGSFGGFQAYNPTGCAATTTTTTTTTTTFPPRNNN